MSIFLVCGDTCPSVSFSRHVVLSGNLFGFDNVIIIRGEVAHRSSRRSIMNARASQHDLIACSEKIRHGSDGVNYQSVVRETRGLILFLS